MFENIKGNHDTDNEWNFMDGTYVKAQQHAAGGIEPVENKTIGPSRGGNTTKVHMLRDTHGHPIACEITGGNIHDVTKGEALLSKSAAENIIADKAYDADYLRDAALLKQMIPHIPRKSNSSKPNLSFDKLLYRHRHLIENRFARLKQNLAFATRYDKLTRNFAATVFISYLLIWLKL